MTRERLRRLLPAGCRLGRDHVHLQRVSSTNDWLKNRILEHGQASCDGMLVTTAWQGGGRGRRQRDWWSGPEGANLCLSLLVDALPQPLECLGLHAACAWAETVGRWVHADTKIALKWPNDLWLDGAKAGGILVERPSALTKDAAILGLGLNLGAAPPVEAAPYATTCVANHARGSIDRDAWLASWILALDRRLQQHRRCGPARLEQDFLAWMRRWAPHGVHEPRSGVTGPLLEFSVLNGLTWGSKGHTITRAAGWIESLAPLPAQAG